jgi:uncharacterized delta-60 repeat protein
MAILRLGALILIGAPLSATAAVGELDPSFGDHGQVLVDGNFGPNVVELADGRILVVGGAGPTDPPAPDWPTQVAMSRFLPTGAPDTSFGGDGRRYIDLFPDQDTTILILVSGLQSDGKVIVAGSYWSGGGMPFVARINANGAPDASFGSGGVSEPGTGGTEPYYSSLIVREDGLILASISDWTSDRIDQFGPDGRSLGNLIRTDFAPARMARQSDGRLVVSGYWRSQKQQGLMRFDIDGTIDETFGDSGFAAIDGGYNGNLAVEPSTDRIVLCGPGLVRLTSDGHLDTTFGVQGTGYVAFGNDSVPAYDYCHKLLAMWDGSIVFIGIRSGEAAAGDDHAFVSGLTSSGLADLRFGDGSGASELQLGSILGSSSWWGDVSSAFIATHDGDALLTWVTTDGLKLARINLDAGDAGEVSPPSPPADPPLPPAEPPPDTSTPPPEASSGGGGGGGGGSWAWPDLGLLVLSLMGLSRRRRI